MSALRCPVCGKAFDPQESRSMPFCSPRCRQIDLRRWLNEEISIPVRELDEDHPGRDAEDEDTD